MVMTALWTHDYCTVCDKQCLPDCVYCSEECWKLDQAEMARRREHDHPVAVADVRARESPKRDFMYASPMLKPLAGGASPPLSPLLVSEQPGEPLQAEEPLKVELPQSKSTYRRWLAVTGEV